MKIFSWNLQGLGNPWTVRALKLFIKNNSPDIFFFMETKLMSNEFSSICSTFSSFNCFVVDADGRRGGLVLFWRKQIDVRISNSSSNHIDFAVMDVEADLRWRGVGVYGWPESQNKHRTCELVKSFSGGINQALLLFGDFNLYLHHDEKEGGRRSDEREMASFRDAMDTCSVVDLGHSGGTYTWSNGRKNNDLVQIRLDRFLSNNQWRESYPEWGVVHLTRFKSDHCPIVLNTSSPIVSHRGGKGSQIFRFEQMWMTHDLFDEAVYSAWNDSCGYETEFMGRMEACGASLKDRAYSNFDNLSKQMKKKLAEL
ncbi:uncharacterized protein LOC126664524 [Mercurialis annua]|uniref:uncharacterized protein LOC126664524 n=1 Tax=Mercurialis annua TaxID=3986 RepID=UPI00215F0AEB|nr:uncharacterized protein LOC126664524 [Mercurialis annua]